MSSVGKSTGNAGNLVEYSFQQKADKSGVYFKIKEGSDEFTFSMYTLNKFSGRMHIEMSAPSLQKGNDVQDDYKNYYIALGPDTVVNNGKMTVNQELEVYKEDEDGRYVKSHPITMIEANALRTVENFGHTYKNEMDTEVLQKYDELYKQLLKIASQ